MILLAVFTALVVVLSFVKIPLGPFSVTLTLPVIVIGGALCGVWAGAWLGAVFSVMVFVIGDAAAFLAICLTYKKYKASAKDTDSDWENKLKTFKQLFDLSDFLVVSTFYCSLIVLITKLAGRVINDVVNIVATGLPTEPKTYFMMLANYSISILFAVFCYFVMLLVISFLGDKFKAADSKEK